MFSNNYACMTIIVLILLYIFLVSNREDDQDKLNDRKEPYRSCSDCVKIVPRKYGYPIINPFIQPYSGSQCIGDIYKSTFSPTTTPDHVLLT